MIKISGKIDKSNIYKGFSSSDILFFYSKNFFRLNILFKFFYI